VRLQTDIFVVIAFAQVPETEEEALCLLELAYTQRDISKITKTLTEHHLKESSIHVRLLNIQSRRARKNLDQADLRVGQVRSVVHDSGYSVYTEEHLAHELKGLFIPLSLWPSF
jgi:hypothetical protein